MNLILVSTMPRSGSTLLQNLLAQNPNHHCTSTNDLLDCLMAVRDKWTTCPGFIAQGLDNIEPRILNMICFAIQGFYFNEKDKVVFDKCRGHLANIELLEKVLGRKVKVIVTVRDIRDVVASFEKIYRASVLTEKPIPPVEQLRKLTVRGRAERLLDPSHTIGYVLHSLKDVYDRGLQDRLVIVPYHELTHRPVQTIKRVCRECGIADFACDPKNVEQVTQEDDTVWGMKLHTIRSKVEPDKGEGWKGILPDDFAEFLDKEYWFFQQMAKGLPCPA
jgi:sulfotransferase